MITSEYFGEYDGKTVKKYLFTDGFISVELCNYGATLLSLFVPDKNGVPTNVLLGYKTLEEYVRYDGYLGATIGRIANRTGGASFVYEGKEYKLYANDGENSLHGGRVGFDKKVWNANIFDDHLVMTLESPDGEEGYFGNLDVEADFFIDSDHSFNIVYTAVTDTESAVNLTNHAYFNLNGEGNGNVLEHSLKVNASCVTIVGDKHVSTGEFLDVNGTPFDFTVPKAIGKDIEARHPQLETCGGYDQNFVLDLKDYDGLAAVAIGDKSGVKMSVYTNQNGMQLYTANMLGLRKGSGDRLYDKHDAFCLEPQSFPNALNLTSFGQPIIRFGEVYTNQIKYLFTIAEFK